jgi:CheY-like chemotaxis protein
MLHKVSFRREAAGIAPHGEHKMSITESGTGFQCNISPLPACAQQWVPSYSFPVFQTQVEQLSQTPQLSHPLPSAQLAQNKFILVIDDSATVRKIVEICLGREGFGIKGFPDGVEALHWLTASPTRIPDLVWLDIGLPKMDGYEVARHFKANPQFANTVIAMLTRRDGLIDRLKGRLAGAKVYMTKPIKTQDVVFVTRSLLGLASPEQETLFQSGAACT